MRTLDVLVTLFAGLAGTGVADPEIITVEHNFSAIICAGYCTNSHLTVRSDGLVDLSVTPLRVGKRPRHLRFRVTPQEFAEFRRVYAAIRPKGLRGPVGNCDPHTLVIDWDIRWDGPEANSRLLACRDIEDVQKAHVEGYRVLRIRPGTVQRISKREAELLR